MSAATVRRILSISSFALAMLLATASFASNTVNPGYDLFTTRAGTQYDFSGLGLGIGMLALEGRPLGSYDFGSGPVMLPHTDTIVERKAIATAPSTVIPIEIVALQLKSVDPVDIGWGPEFIHVDLNSAISGSMTINFGAEPPPSPHGNFDSTLSFWVDVSGTTTGFHRHDFHLALEHGHSVAPCSGPRASPSSTV